MQIILSILAILLVVSALVYGIKKHLNNKKQQKKRIDSMTDEERTAYYLDIEERKKESKEEYIKNLFNNEEDK